jgi:hypothetical protein
MDKKEVPMHEARALFLSLPASARSDIRAAAKHNDPTDLRKLIRAVYPYVHTFTDAQEIAYYLAGETDSNVDDVQPVHREESAVSLTKMLVRLMYGPP